MIPSVSTVASFASIGVGTLLGVLRPRSLRKLEEHSPKAMDALLTLLVFTSSVAFGCDPTVTASLASLGVISAVTALLTMAASALAAHLWRAQVGRSLRTSVAQSSAEQVACTGSEPSTARWAVIRPAIAVVAGWAAGIAVQPGLHSAEVAAVAGTSSSVSLWALLVVIGYDAGKDRIWLRFKEFGPLAVTLPLAIGTASLLASALAAALLPVSLPTTLAAGSGFGWYSLAGPMTLAQKGVEAGAFVFLSNLIREIASLIVVPLLSGKTTPQVAASLGGATSMDSVLPVISRTFGSEGTAWGLICGTTLSLACPFVVQLCLSF